MCIVSNFLPNRQSQVGVWLGGGEDIILPWILLSINRQKLSSNYDLVKNAHVCWDPNFITND